MKYPAIGLVYLYRYTVGLLFPPSCKYYPSCSSYAIGVLERYGLIRGFMLSAWRLLRCNPWSKGGVDMPADARLFGRPCRAHGEQPA
ncbi:MAG: membrane protein insertion efficiency factor YidD [Gaiellaceae bacterium]|jgi:putative membrane protein insertion efficiency factor